MPPKGGFFIFVLAEARRRVDNWVLRRVSAPTNCI